MSVQASLSLGAYDLKKYYTRSLGIAFLVSLLFHVLLLGGKEVIDVVLGNSSKAGEEEIVSTGPVTLDDFKEEMKEETNDIPPEDIIPPPPPMAATAEIGTGSEGAMGKLVATNEEFEGPDIQDMSKIEMSNALGGGDGGKIALDPNTIDMPKEKLVIPKNAVPTTEKSYGMDDFVADVHEAAYSNAKLIELLEYPQIAKENNLEGKVVVSAQISTTGGRPLRVVIRSSSSKTFEEAAKRAVEKLDFTPATQNGHPIKMWKTFTVFFKLK